jgi:hypothetical protein
MEKKYLYCEETNTRIYPNDILTISIYPNIKYIAKHGWYRLGTAQKNGWYFVSIADKSILPLESIELADVVKNVNLAGSSDGIDEYDPDNQQEVLPEFLYCETTDTKIYPNDCVKLSPVSDVKYTAKYGEYNIKNKKHQGWYFLSVETGEIIPLSEVNLNTLIKEEQQDISLFKDMDALPTETNYIVIPGTDIRLYDSDIVKISNKPRVKWIVHLGWYIYDDVQHFGWYFESVKDGEILPVSIVDLTLCTLVTVKTQGSERYDGKVVNYTRPFTVADSEILRRAFITVDTIAQRDNIDKKKLINGKMVRVNAEEGPAQYFAWNAETQTWEYLEVFGIPEIVGTTRQPIVLSELDPGLVRVKGTYKISPTYEMITFTPIDHIVFVANTDDLITIKVITDSTITDYQVEDEDVVFVNEYATYKYLEEHYATKIYVDNAIAVIEGQISDLIANFDERVLAVMNESLDNISEEYIDNLFE